MPKIVYGRLLKNRIEHSMIENEYKEKRDEQALIANANAKKNRGIRNIKQIIYVFWLASGP